MQIVLYGPLPKQMTDLIGNSYLTKGSVYYFTYRKYQKALDQYLKAWQYLEK
jgi:hypothetical protein